MSKRQQLPPQIKKVQVKDRRTGKLVVRYQLTVDAGSDPESGKRRQIRRRFASEAAARDELASVQGGVKAGTYVHSSKLTVNQVWRMSRVLWNFGGGPVSIRLRSPDHCARRVRHVWRLRVRARPAGRVGVGAR
jgi:Arm DNA-binding domain